MNQKLPDFQAGFRNGRGNRDHIANIHWIIEKMEISEKYLSLFLSAKAFDYVDHDKLWKAPKEMEYQIIFPVSWETCMWVKKQQIEPCMELIGSRLRKEYDRAICCHRVCLTYMLGTSWEMLGWKSYKLESK